MKNLRKENRTKTHKPAFKFNAKNISNYISPSSKESNLNPSSQNCPPIKKQSHAIQEPSNLKLQSSSSEKRLSTNLTTETTDNKERNKNIRVYVRFRPFNIIETELLSTGVGWETPEYKENEIVTIKTNKNNNDNNGPSFKFDKVFNSETPQVEIYNYVGKEIVKDVMDGYNGTIFAYGQSGSGKTFTMYGKDIDDEESKGLIPRIVSNIFDYVENCDENTNFQFKLSVLQIYKEVIYDLLTGEKNLQIKENPARGIYVDGLSEVYLSSVDDFLNYAELAEKNRKVGETRLNQQSSRSHSIMILEVSQQLKKENLIKKGILNLVDLAGSEKVSKTGAVGETLEEAKKINLSLSALGNVIHALTSNSEHIPYRDSKLTRILQESLGGNYKTSLIVACSPHSYNVDETVSSLQFAQRAKTIKNKVKVNIKYTYEELQQMVFKLNKKLEIANMKISKLQNGEKVEFEGNYDNCPNCEGLKEEKKNLEERVEELMNEIKEKNDRINELEEEEDSFDSDDGVKNKIYKLYKQIKSELDVIKENNSNFENDKIKENIIIQNENLDNLIANYMKNSDKNEFFNEINSLTKKGFNINREEKYEEIYNEYKKNLEEIFENKIYKENNISDNEKLNLFSINYFYEYLQYYFSYQLLYDGYEKIKIDNKTLLNMTKSLLSLVDKILSTNYEIANDKTLNANAINFLKTTIFDNNNMNLGQTQNQESNNQLMNLSRMNKRMSVTFGGDLQKNLVKIVTKKNMNIMKNAGRRCSMIITEGPIEHVSNSTSSFVPSYRRTSVSIPFIFPKSFNNSLNINKNNLNVNDNNHQNNKKKFSLIDEMSEIKEYSENADDKKKDNNKIESDNNKNNNENNKNENVDEKSENESNKNENENDKNENENEKSKNNNENNKSENEDEKSESESNKSENEDEKSDSESNKSENEDDKSENESNKSENENDKNENESNKSENENENEKSEKENENNKSENENEKSENKNDKNKNENNKNENENKKIENDNKNNKNDNKKIENDNNKNENNKNENNKNENNKNENVNNKKEDEIKKIEEEEIKNQESLQKVQKVFNSTEKKQSKLTMIKDLLIANVTKTEELKKYFKEQKEDFDKIIKLNKEYFTNIILKKQGISNNNSFFKNNESSKNEIKNQNEKIINSENSEDKKLNEKELLTNNNQNNNNSNNNIIENNDNTNKNTIQENDNNNKEINNENTNNEINNDINNESKDINNNENKIEIKEEKKKLKSTRNNFLKSSPKKDIKNSNNEIPYTKKDNEIIKLKSNNETIKNENDPFKMKISKNISNKNIEEINNSSIKSKHSRTNTDHNIKRPSSSNIQISRKNSNKNTSKKSSKKNLKLHEEILNSNTSRNIFLHNKSNSDYLNIKKEKNERRVFSLENYIEKYLETGTVTRKFDGIKVNLDHGKIKCIYAGGLNAHHKMTGNPLQNQKLKESKGDDDSVQSSIGN